MSRQTHSVWLVLSLAVITAFGCQPMQPLFFNEDGDLSHYLDVATEVEYPDVDHTPLDEVTQSHAPVTLETVDKYERWHLSLEEVLQTVLSNSQVMRAVGGRIVRPNYATAINERASTALTNRVIATGGATTSYDPAIVESAYGVSTGSDLSSGTGVEAALAAFDARLDGGMFWEKQDRPQNVQINNTTAPFLVPTLQQDLGTFNLGLTKVAASGTTFSFFNNTVYDLSNNPTRALPSAFNTNFVAGVSQPLLQGAGAQYNRIAGPQSFSAYQQGIPNQIDGVVIGRIRHDINLAQFEGQLIELIQEAESAYWDLYYSYREMEANRQGQEYSRDVWEKKNGDPSASAADKSRARAEYFRFRAEVESSLTNLMGFENRLRYLMGLAVADGRLITPSDDPTTAGMSFDWCLIHPEAIARRVEVRKQKWEIKKREMELIASRNSLLPRLDAIGRYRWLGMGDDLISTDGANGLPPQAPGSNAFDSLLGGQYQEWEMGLQLSMPIGFRQALTGVRHQQLLLAREKALMDDLELEISHQLGDALRILQSHHHIIQTNFNRRIAAEEEVKAMLIAEEEGRITLDSLLDAERRKVDSQIAYYRSLTDYNLAIMRVHYRKGSLLEYNSVYLAEGPWPKKAYFDAMREARRRDAAMFLDYGFTRPGVVSQGPYTQHSAEHGVEGEYQEFEGETYEYSNEGDMPTEAQPEEVPTPASDPKFGEPEVDMPMEPAPADSARHNRNSSGPLLQPATTAMRTQGNDNQAGNQWQSAGANRVAQTRNGSQSRPTNSARQMSYEQSNGQQQYEFGKTQQAVGSTANAAGWQRTQR